jgi:hypothetical protein
MRAGFELALDDLPWNLPLSDEHATRAILEALINLLRAHHERDKAVAAWQDTENDLLAATGKSLLDVLEAGRRSPVLRDTLTSLRQRLQRLVRWSDVGDPLVHHNGIEHLAPSVARTAGPGQERTGLVGPPGTGRAGSQDLQLAGQPPVSRWFLSDEAVQVKFVRQGLIEGSVREQEFGDLAAHAFPNLYFVEGLWGGLRDLEGGFIATRLALIRHLSVLSDHGATAFASGKHLDIQRAFLPHGIDIAPENSATMADRDCRAARTRRVGGRDVVCEWHTKIEGHRNRIHVHAPVPESGEKLIVGVIHRHLPTK